jgi:hypothetical protein
MMHRLAPLLFAACSSATAATPGATTYSCDGITIAAQSGHADPAIATWRALAEAHDADVAWIARVQAEAGQPLPKLALEARVRLQHHMVAVARRLDDLRREFPQWSAWSRAHADVLAQIHAIAPTAAELATLGDGAHPRVAAVLGSQITERATKTCGSGNSIHASVAGGTLAYRPLRAGQTRALVSQLVAYDRDGNPHITPLVDTMELRVGEDPTAVACVVQAADDGTLHAAAHADIHEHGPFVQKRGDGVGCINCHSAPNAMRARDLTFDEVPAIDKARDGQVDRMATGLWKRLSERL